MKYKLIKNPALTCSAYGNHWSKCTCIMKNPDEIDELSTDNY